MSPVKFCPEHGPYDASFASCPQCGGQPAMPSTLDEMDVLETDITPSPPRFNDDADPTFIPGQLMADDGSADRTMINSDISRQIDQTQLAGARSVLVDAIFWVKEGSRRGKYYPVRNNTVIGRKEGQLILDDLKVSGTHAKITLNKKKYTIWDFGSSNGTFVNGKRITEATPIDENDEIQIGDTVFILKLLSAKKKKPAASNTKKITSTSRKKTTTKATSQKKPSENEKAE